MTSRGFGRGGFEDAHKVEFSRDSSASNAKKRRGEVVGDPLSNYQRVL